MKAIEHFSLETPAVSLAEDKRSKLLFDGQETGLEMEEEALEAQFQWHDYYVLVVMLDNPREEVLRCLVLDRSFHVKSQCQYSGWFTSFMLSRCEVKSPNSLILTINKGLKLIVSVTMKRGLRLIKAPKISLSVLN